MADLLGADQGVTTAKLTDDEIHGKLVGWVSDYQDQSLWARTEARIDRDYKTGKQWTAEQISRLARRKQAPVVSNRIAPKINFVLGNEIRTKVDPHAFPRTPKHEDDAEIATDALRFVTDQEDFDAVAIAVTDQVLVEGAGGVLLEPETVPDPDAPGKKRVDVRLREVYYDRLIADPHSRKPDYSDALYLGLWNWVDWEVAKEDPQYQNETAQSVLGQTHHGHGRGDDDSDDFSQDRPWDWYDSDRNRIRITYLWYRDVDKDGRDLWMVCHLTGAGILFRPKPVVLLDDCAKPKNWCPLVLTSGYIDAQNNRYGIVRDLRSPQDEINHRKSKALYLLSLRQVVAEDGAFVNEAEAQVEFGKPDGFVRAARGALAEKRFEVLQNGDMAMGQFQLLEQAKGDIDSIGPSAALALASTQQAQSGRAFLARQEAGMMELGAITENLRKWKIRVFRRIWWMVRQYWQTERWFRVRDDNERSGFKFVAVNRTMTRSERLQELLKKQVPIQQAVKIAMGDDGLAALQEIAARVQQQVQIAAQQGAQIGPEAGPMIEQQILAALLNSPIGQENIKTGDVAQLDVDIILETVPSTAVIEHEQFTELMQLSQSPAMAAFPPGKLLRVVIEASTLRNKDRLLNLIDEQPSPQEQQAAQAQQQMQQQMLQMQMAQMQAQIQTLQAQGTKLAADAQRSQAQAAQAAAQVQMLPAEAQLTQARAAQAAAQTARIGAEIDQTIPAQAQRDVASAAKAAVEAGQSATKQVAIVTGATGERP